MKKILSRIKIGIVTLWVTLISFFSKVVGQTDWANPRGEPMYWIQPAPISNTYSITIAIKVAQVFLIAIVFIVWIINFIRIRKIEDKILRKKKIKKIVIVISILIILIIALVIFAPLLKEYFS